MEVGPTDLVHNTEPQKYRNTNQENKEFITNCIMNSAKLIVRDNDNP